MQQKILCLIEEAMEAEEGSVQLGQSLEWDSLAIVIFMGSVDEQLNKRISADKLTRCETIDAVVQLVANA